VCAVPTQVATDIHVPRFGYVGDEHTQRLVFPRAELSRIEGRSGSVEYGAGEGLFDNLEGRLGTVRWTTDAASLGHGWLRDDAGRFHMEVERIEMPKGVMLTRAESGVELVAPHVSFSEMRLMVKGRSSEEAPAQAPAASAEPPALRQDKLRFLDSLSGRIYVTVKVVLDLPVLKRRTLDQVLKVPIQEGSLDFRALDDSLDWLEGAFIDISHDRDRLALQWKVPIFGSGRDLVWWPLDEEAATLASFGRVPVRSLSDFRFPNAGSPKADDKRKTLQALSLDAIDIALSLLAPRSLEVGGGLIMFGGDDSPGMVDLKVTGDIHDRGPGKLQGAIGSIDTTIKDLHFGGTTLTADRLHFDGLDQLEVTFDGFTPTSVTMLVARVTATNLSLLLGSSRPQ
jgi:hypothetical protein